MNQLTHRNPNYGLQVLCASQDENPRKIHSVLLKEGWQGFYEHEVEQQVLASDCGLVMLRYPGGVGDSPLLEFDMMSQCAKDARCADVGKKSELAWVLGQLRQIGCKTALYLGAVRDHDSSYAATIESIARTELSPYEGVLDYAFVDSACESGPYGAYPIVCRVAHHFGITCAAENRALPGRYSHLMNHEHCIIGETWDATGGIRGDADHAPIVPGMKTPWILDDNGHAGDAARWMAETGRVMCGWKSGIKASDLTGVIG